MHQGVVRVAVCFFAKFGVFYVFCAWILSLISLYALMSYLTSAASGVGQRTPPASAGHLRLASNARHLRLASAGGRPSAATAGDLPAFVRAYDVLPACGDREEAFLNILITSAPRNFGRRRVIRSTWCSRNATSVAAVGDRTVPDRATRCVFLLGSSLSASIQAAVRGEAARHRDILRGFYLDSYRNLTVKVLQGFVWSHERCPASFALKTDDDCFVNVPILKLLLLGEGSPRANAYIGHVVDDEARRRVIRDPDSKWRVSPGQYSPRHYPPYASGFGYVLSSDLVELVAAVYHSVELIPVEDAYVGIVLDSVGVTPAHSDRFDVHSIKWHLCNLLYFVVIHRVGAEAQRTIASQCMRSYLECSISGERALSWD